MSIWEGKVCEFQYTNHRGEVAMRRAVPRDLVFEKSEFYPQHGEEWFLVAWCLEKQAERRFMLSRMWLIDKAHDQSLPWRTQ